MSPPPLGNPTVIADRYVVERELGRGATATVYLAQDRQTSGHLAIKVLRPELAESVGADRFIREIRLTGGLQHPNILPVLDSGADGQLLYCTLPYMEGGTLRDRILSQKQLTIAESVSITVTLAGALAYAHGRGLIHRDIKPENILFGGGKAYLGDFGIARLLHATAGEMTTTTGVVRGTPAYMSPEQASGERDYDGRSDIYSLACVVYEMISGMPPFVGPTSQSVLAQRFTNKPRPMRVYRETVTAEVERVVEKAMMTAPADRYASATEFSDELEVAARSVVATRSYGVVGRRNTKLIVASAIGVGLIVAGAFAVNNRAGAFGAAADVPTDTTQLAILPFSREGNTDTLGSVDALLYEAFSAWRGISVREPFAVREAVRRQGSASGISDHKVVAIALRAGRFVRGSVSARPGGTGWTMQAWLHQVDVDTALIKASVTIAPSDLIGIDRLYASLARTLLLRGRPDSAAESSQPSTTFLPAMQSFAGGIDALDQWDFARADSLFQGAIEIDGRYARAYLWQAQIRSWQRIETRQWLHLVEKALVDSMRLPTRDRQLATALVALGRREFEQSCAEYRALKEKNPSDFAAWFGLGRCQDLDNRVVRDAASPTGWRYLASYQGAIDAYQEAFRVLSLSHRSLERGSFEPLRELLAMRPSGLRAAIPPAGEPPVQLLGRLDRAGDTLVMRPVLASLVTAGDPAAVPAGLKEAIVSQQTLFRSIAASWSTSLPKSAGAKEAVVVALEMRGDRSALDTLRVARRLVADPLMALRLAVTEAILRLKFVSPGDRAEVEAIRGLADSLLAAHPTPSAPEAGYLLALAALTGRCARAGELVSRSPVSLHPGIARDVLGDADALAAKTVLGCATNGSAELSRLRQRILTSQGSPSALNSLLSRTVRLTLPVDTAQLAAFAASSGDYLLRAQLAVVRGRPDSARWALAKVNAARARTGYDDVTPDAIYLESRLLLGLGDTAAAVVALDRLFERLPFLTPGALSRPVPLGGLLRAMQLRSEIASARRESGDAVLWGGVKETLWSNAERGAISGPGRPPNR